MSSGRLQIPAPASAQRLRVFCACVASWLRLASSGGNGDALRKPGFPALVFDQRTLTLQRVPVRSNHLSRVMPAPGLDPGIVAGIHVFLADSQLERRGWPGQARP